MSTTTAAPPTSAGPLETLPVAALALVKRTVPSAKG